MSGLKSERSFEAARCVVTGGAGAIGSNLVERLVEQGATVIVIDDYSSGRRDNLRPDTAIRVIEGSVVDDASLDQAFAEPVHYVFHLATLFANQNSVEHPERDLAVNGLGTLKVLERARRCGVKRVVFSSSSCVYAPSNDPRRESAAHALDTPYAITKLLGEHYLAYYQAFHGVPTTVLRYFNSFGPKEYPGQYRNVIPNFVARAMRGEALVITGTGSETRTFTYVDDIVRATQLAALHPQAVGEVFNIGADREISIREVAEMIIAECESQSELRYGERRSWDHVTRRRADVSRAERVLGFRAEISFEDGLRRTVAWLGSTLQSGASSG